MTISDDTPTQGHKRSAAHTVEDASKHPHPNGEQRFSGTPAIIEAEPLEATQDQREPMTDRQRAHLLFIRMGEERGAENNEIYHDCALEAIDELHRDKHHASPTPDHIDDHHVDDDFDLELSRLDRAQTLMTQLYPDITQQTLELDGVTPQALLHDHLFKLYTTNTLAPALLATDHIEHADLYKRLSQCADGVTIREDNSVYHHNRCNMRICPLCSSINARKLIAKLKNVVRSDTATFRLASSDDNPLEAHKRKVHALCLGFNLGTRCHLYEIRDYIKALNATWKSFYTSRRVEQFIEGFYRATEVALEPSEETLSAHVHLHITILVDASSVTLEEALDYANETLIPIWVNRARKTIKRLKLNAQISRSGQSAFPLNAQNMGELIGWLSYCAKGTIPSEANKLRKLKRLSVAQHADAWRALDSQLKHQRLTSDGGVFAESRQAYERAEELRKLDRVIDEADEPSTPSRAKHKREAAPPRITHLWTHTGSHWKSINEYDHELECSPEALLRGLQFHHGRDKVFTLIREIKEHQRRVIEDQELRDAADKQADDRWRMAYWMSTGKAPPKASKQKRKDGVS